MTGPRPTGWTGEAGATRTGGAVVCGTGGFDSGELVTGAREAGLALREGARAGRDAEGVGAELLTEALVTPTLLGEIVLDRGAAVQPATSNSAATSAIRIGIISCPMSNKTARGCR